MGRGREGGRQPVSRRQRHREREREGGSRSPRELAHLFASRGLPACGPARAPLARRTPQSLRRPRARHLAHSPRPLSDTSERAHEARVGARVTSAPPCRPRAVPAGRTRGRRSEVRPARGPPLPGGRCGARFAGTLAACVARLHALRTLRCRPLAPQGYLRRGVQQSVHGRNFGLSCTAACTGRRGGLCVSGPRRAGPQVRAGAGWSRHRPAAGRIGAGTGVLVGLGPEPGRRRSFGNRGSGSSPPVRAARPVDLFSHFHIYLSARFNRRFTRRGWRGRRRHVSHGICAVCRAGRHRSGASLWPSPAGGSPSRSLRRAGVPRAGRGLRPAARGRRRHARPGQARGSLSPEVGVEVG